jgi:hypothetical protein
MKQAGHPSDASAVEIGGRRSKCDASAKHVILSPDARLTKSTREEC